MIVLFIHQNFPGQYKHLVRHFLETRKARVLFITQANKNVMEGVEKVIYDVQHPPSVNCHPFSIDFDRAVRVGAAAAAACRDLKARGLTPDIILGHNGWGRCCSSKTSFPRRRSSRILSSTITPKMSTWALTQSLRATSMRSASGPETPSISWASTLPTGGIRRRCGKDTSTRLSFDRGFRFFMRE